MQTLEKLRETRDKAETQLDRLKQKRGAARLDGKPSPSSKIAQVEDNIAALTDQLAAMATALFQGESLSAWIGAQFETPQREVWAALGLNVVLDYGLIFGNLGLPEMGMRGSALATVLAQAAGMAVIMLTALSMRRRKPWKKPATRPLMKRSKQLKLRFKLQKKP